MLCVSFRAAPTLKSNDLRLLLTFQIGEVKSASVFSSSFLHGLTQRLTHAISCTYHQPDEKRSNELHRNCTQDELQLKQDFPKSQVRGHDKNSAIMVQVGTHLIAQIVCLKPGSVNTFCCCVAMFCGKVLGGFWR